MSEIFFVKNHPTGTAIFLMILCTIFTSLGQILWKFGLNKIDFSFLFTIFNFPFILGFVFYGLGFGLMLLAFKYGELTVLFPIIATSYVWVSLLSSWIFPEDSMNLWKWLGIIVILLGVGFLGKASEKKKVSADD
jgi:drug/metabolite transporter (DMT)-like permease